MEASALQAPAGLARRRLSIGAPLLRLRSDEQLVALFRAGHEEAFRVIHERYRARLFAYTRQMLRGSSQDAEDATQDIFVRAYSGLRSDHREVALRAWLYRIAHNRCIDELRRPAPPAPELLEQICSPVHDPTVEAEQRDSLRRLLIDVQRLPEQQRSALMMRELGGVPYADLAAALDVSVPALKSLLVRARVSLAQSVEARNMACSQIREELITAHDRGVRPSGLARRHMRDCPCCRNFRTELRGMSSQFAALVPTLGPIAVVAKALGFGGVSGGAGSGAAAGSGAITASGAIGTGGAVSVGVIGAGHVATLLAAAVVTAAGAVGIQQTISPPSNHQAHHQIQATPSGPSPNGASNAPVSATQSQGSSAGTSAPAQTAQPVRVPAPAKSVAAPPAAPQLNAAVQSSPPTVTTPNSSGGTSPSTGTADNSPPPSTNGSGTGSGTGTGTGTGTTTVPPSGVGTPLTGNTTGSGGSSSGPPSGTTTTPPPTTLPPSTGGSSITTPPGTSNDPAYGPPSLATTTSGSGGSGSS